jgi:hypothetical protein
VKTKGPGSWPGPFSGGTRNFEGLRVDSFNPAKRLTGTGGSVELETAPQLSR